MKVIVVGSSHGGFEAVREILADRPDAEIQWYEKGDFLSFLSCGMQLYLEGIVKNVNDVSYATPEGMRAQGVSVFTETEVTAVDAKQHSVYIVDHKNGQKREEQYDKLILSPGATPATLPVAGNDLKNIYAMRGRDWAIKLKERTVDPEINDVVVIGAGYIGIEAAETFAKAGKHVTVVDMLPRLLAKYLDEELTDIVTKEMEKHDIKAAPGQAIKKFVGKNGHVTQVITDQATYPADLVIVATGIKPNTKWLSGVVDLDDHGMIKVDDQQRTSADDIYAVGDATLVKFAPTNGTKSPIALATNARRQGRIAGKNAVGIAAKTPLVSGSSALSVFKYKFASTGIKKGTAAQFNLETKSTLVTDTFRPSFVPDENGNGKVWFKLTYDPQTTRILGAQILSTQDVTQNINTISLAIQAKLTLSDLAYADFFFQPGFDRPWNIMNVGAQQALRDLEKNK